MDAQTLERLSTLELRLYAGDLGAFGTNDWILRNELTEIPVEVRVIIEDGRCDDALYKLCEQVEGMHETFGKLREGITDALAKGLGNAGWNLLSVLFDGIYAGEPEDLLNHRTGGMILYPVKGLGEKIAEVTFLEKDAWVNRHRNN
jgi:hypothetical protein